MFNKVEQGEVYPSLNHRFDRIRLVWFVFSFVSPPHFVVQKGIFFPAELTTSNGVPVQKKIVKREFITRHVGGYNVSLIIPSSADAYRRSRSSRVQFVRVVNEATCPRHVENVGLSFKS